MTARDRGSAEYTQYMNERRKIRTASWEAMENQGWENVGVSAEDVQKRLRANEAKEAAANKGKGGGGGFQMPTFEMPKFEMPSAPSAPAPAPAPMPAGPPAPGPFDWLTELFQPTTTTTTTTLDPFSAFFKGLR